MFSWFNANQNYINAAVLYKAWFTAKRNAYEIKSYILSWCTINCTTFEAGSLYTAWIESVGNLIDLKPYVITWIEKFRGCCNENYQSCNWIECRNEVEYVFGSLTKLIQCCPVRYLLSRYMC